MTVSFAICCSDDSVLMAGDSFCGSSAVSDLCLDPKVSIIEDVLGFCLAGEIRSEQIISREIIFQVRRRQKKGKEITPKWLASRLPDILQDSLSIRGSLLVKEGIANIPDSSFLLCLKGHIYHLECDFSVWESQAPYAVLGAGREFALGALGAMLPDSMDRLPTPEEATLIAKATLDSCVKWSPWVLPPYTITTLR